MVRHLISNRRLRRLFPRVGMAFVLLFLLTIGSVATAQEKDERELKVDLSQSKAVIESKSKVVDREDELKIEFDNGSHNFYFEYASESTGSELEVEIKVELFDLIEWRDVNGNGRYDPDVSEELVQKIGLGELSPQSLNYEAIEVEGVQGVKLVGISADPDKYPELTMTLTLYMFGEFLKFADTSLEPTSMKFDIEIKGFPFQGDDTSLALYAKVVMKAEDEAEDIGEEGEEAIGARVGKYISFFSWDTTVTVDGQQSTVDQNVRKHEQKTELGEAELVSELYLLYPRGNTILHDPKMGVRLPQASGVGLGCSPSN